MSSRGRQILEALATQLATISTSIGYYQTVRRVITSFGEITLNTPEVDLPLIEIVNDEDGYEHEATATYWANMRVILFLVAPKDWTDGQMEDFKSDIIKCLFGGGANASGNTGITLGGVVQSIHLISARGDLNLIESNRTYVLRIQLRSLRKTYTG